MSLAALLGRARSAWQAWAPDFSHPATGYLLILMTVGGVVLRIQNVGYPFHFNFDENQFVGAAHQFLTCMPDASECCHPPLAKLIIGVGMVICGNNPWGWRFMPLVFGLQCIVLAFLIADALFKDRRAAWLAAAFVAVDGFYIAFSRVAFPEVILACLNLWALFAAITARSFLGVLTCAVLVGLAASVKWVGLFVGLPACFALLLFRRVRWYTLAAFIVVPFVHLAVWMIGLGLIGQPNDPMAVWNEIRRRQSLHLGFPHGTNPIESSWYTWLVMYHPIIVKSTYSGLKARLASGVGNPLLWFTTDVCLLALPVLGTAWALRVRCFRERWSRWFDSDMNKGLAILGVAWLSMMLLWMSERIVTYWYHYMTPYGLALLMAAGMGSRLDRRLPRAMLVYVALVLAISAYLAPVWAEIPTSMTAVRQRLIFPLWR